MCCAPVWWRSGCGYGNDFDWLRSDVAFKLACGRLLDTGRDHWSQPTISRWENAPAPEASLRQHRQQSLLPDDRARTRFRPTGL
jgi:hypothetical protein